MQSELANGIEYAFPAREKYSGIFWQNAKGPGKWASGKNSLENRDHWDNIIFKDPAEAICLKKCVTSET